MKFLPALSLDASGETRGPRPPGEAQRMPQRQIQRFPNTLTQDDTQPVDIDKDMEPGDVKHAGRLVSSAEQMYTPPFHPERWEWMLLGAWWSVPPVESGDTRIPRLFGLS